MSEIRESVIQKERVPNSDAPKRITGVDFRFLGPTEIRKMSSATITKCDFYETTSNKPAAGGVLDLRLGTTSNTYPCQTCGKNSEDCPGHFGSIELLFPIFNTGYYPHIIHVLKCICKTCSRLLLTDEEITKKLRRLFLHPAQNVSVRGDQMKSLIELCKSVKVCPHCGALNGQIRKGKSLLVIGHQIGLPGDSIREAFTKDFENMVVSDFSSVEKAVENVMEDLTPVRVLHLFDHIPKRELPILMSGFRVASPTDMIIRTLIVPPNCIRPSVIAAGEGSTEDDLTIRLREAIDNTMQLQKSIEAGQPVGVVMEKWNMMQQIINSFINSEGPDTILKKKGKKDKPVIGVSQRLKGKQGRFRTNLSGKRVNFSGRTVISPDPNTEVDQVVVPLEMAMTLTFPERVTKHNIEYLRQCVINGPSKYPGANRLFVIRRGQKRDLRYGDREEIAKYLEFGDIVDRHLQPNDIVLFNRQPSLHRISIMAFRAKIMPWRTLRFNECSCAPFNADFDGDEMNVHLPQTVEAAADAKVLMNVLNNLFSPRCGELIVAPTQDFLSGAYLLTRKNVFMDYSHFTFLLAQIFDANVHVDIPPPAILKPVPLWTGKQLISLMIKPNRNCDIDFTHSIANKEYKGNMHMDVQDGWVSFLHSEMISGVLEKSLIGGGTKSLFAVLARDISPKFSAVCMGRIAKLACRFMMNRGFSIGITDVTPNEVLEEKKETVVREAYREADEYISGLKDGTLEVAPGMTIDQTFEMKMNGTLSQVRDNMGKICLAQLSNLNTALVMANSGAKGSAINVSQMMSCLGQQIISGQRVLDDFIDRTIPHFRHHSLEPAAKGFVVNSFFTGLEPYEFFFHTMGGREGLVDAAVKTAETGYLQRRLVKSLEDAVVAYDGTVRVGDGSILQFVYGDDGLDPLAMEKEDFPIDLKRVSNEIMARMRENPLITPALAEIKLHEFLQRHKKDPEDMRPFDIPWFLIEKFESFLEENILKPYGQLLQEFKDKVWNDSVAGRTLTPGELEIYMGIQDHRDPNELDELVLVENEVSIRSLMPVTLEYIEAFYRLTISRLEKALIDPGSTVGAVAAQSIGEPATQMTLKSFHFAGVASMNVSMGVPRIQEVMNAIKTIKTPVIRAKLINDTEEMAARQVKGLIDRIELGKIAKRIEEIENASVCCIEIELDIKIIEEAGMKNVITCTSVRDAILKEKKIGIKQDNIGIVDSFTLQIGFRGMDPSSISFLVQQLMLRLPHIPVTGIPGVSRVLIPKDDQGKFQMFVEGNALLDVMTTSGVDYRHTVSNHIMDVEKVLGIEAARSVIISEISEVYKNYSLSIDKRHLMLLADAMTSKGRVFGINRHGLAKTATSSLKLASFEVTMEHLFNAGFYQINDDAVGATESVILGSFAKMGSGMMDILIAEDMIDHPVLGPKKFLTPQAPSKLRDAIESNSFDPRTWQ